MRKNASLQAVTDELRRANVDFQIEHGVKHLQVRFVLNGRNLMCVVAVSTANWNAHHVARSHVRRLLRQAGEARL
jgi:hypothetical protein